MRGRRESSKTFREAEKSVLLTSSIEYILQVATQYIFIGT